MTPPLTSARGRIGGFNLLPWRRHEVRNMRRRVALEWLAAALVGCLCAAPFAGWRLWQRTQLDFERRALGPSLAQLRAPLAEERRLLREADERRQRLAMAEAQAKPITRLFLLFDELPAANAEGVLLHQIVHRAHETELRATVSGEAATAAWLAKLRSLTDVEAVSVREMKRTSDGGARPNDRQHGPLLVSAYLTWAGAIAGKPRKGSRE